MNRAADAHVRASVDPERGEQKAKLRERRNGLGLLVALAEGAEGEGGGCPGGSDNKHLAVVARQRYNS